MKKIILGVLILISSACSRLDDFMFNADTSIPEYRLDEYDGEVDFVLSSSYSIPDSMVHLVHYQPPDNADETVWAIYLGELNRISQDTVIVYCHGNRDHMDFYWQRAKLLANCGEKYRFGVMMMEYRGFGLSSGKSEEQALIEDVEGAIAWLTSRGLTKERTILYGFSLGSAPATVLAAQEQAGMLILENPFASTEVMVQDAALLAMPASFVTNAKYDNAEKIKNVKQPFLWLHGSEDSFLNIKTHGEVVYKNYSGIRGKGIRVEGAEHGNLPPVMGFPDYLKTIENFIEGKK